MLAAWRGKFWQHLVVSSLATARVSLEPGRQGGSLAGTASLSSTASIRERTFLFPSTAMPRNTPPPRHSADLDRTHQLATFGAAMHD